MGLVADWKSERRRERRWRENVRLHGTRNLHWAAVATKASMLGVVVCGVGTMAAGISVKTAGTTHSLGVDPWVPATMTLAFVVAMALASSWYQSELSLMDLRRKLAALQAEAGAITGGSGPPDGGGRS